jgi:urea-proton symporter
LTITWEKQSKYGAVTGALGGLAAGLTAWLVTAKTYYGELSVTTTGGSYPTLAGNMASVLTGLFLTVVISYIRPDDFDWEITRSINAASEVGTPAPDSSSRERSPSRLPQDTKKKPAPLDKIESNLNHNSTLLTVLDEGKEALEDRAIMEDPTRLRGAFKFACISATVLTLLMDFAIPIPMFLSHYVFSSRFFTGWVVISFIWVFFALGSCAILPVWEAAGFFRDFWGEAMVGKKVRSEAMN